MSADKLPEDLAGLEEVLTDHLEAIVQLGRDTHRMILAVRSMRGGGQPAPVLRIIDGQRDLDSLLAERYGDPT